MTTAKQDRSFFRMFVLSFCVLTAGAVAVSRSVITRKGSARSAIERPPARGANAANESRHAYDSKARIKVASADNFQALVLDAAGTVLVDFHATWCGPCRAQGQVLEHFAHGVKSATIVKVDVDANTELAQRFAVRALPTLLVFQNGRPVARRVGFASNHQLRVLLAESGY